ncbi:MAG: zinc ribbon domain-containing protein [Chloroflexi bacterium]|nr:zinc ribbon domain-containing protein [Chloroflexota bacterium]
MQQWYQCPRCGAPVAFGARFCGNCGTQLNWPAQQQTQPPPVYQEQQRQGYYRYGQQIPEPRKTNPLLIGFVALMAIVLLVAGGVFVFDRLSQGTLSTTPPPSGTSPQEGDKEELSLKSIPLKLTDLPSGWHQAAFQEKMTGQYKTDGVRVVFRNKKYATPEEEISIANSVWLCEEKQAAAYLLEQEEPHFSARKELGLGDRGFFSKRGDGHCEIQFIKGRFYVQLEYYGIPLEGMSEAEKFEFLHGLALKVEAMTPATP